MTLSPPVSPVTSHFRVKENQGLGKGGDPPPPKAPRPEAGRVPLLPDTAVLCVFSTMLSVGPGTPALHLTMSSPILGAESLPLLEVGGDGFGSVHGCFPPLLSDCISPDWGQSIRQTWDRHRPPAQDSCRACALPGVVNSRSLEGSEACVPILALPLAS